MLGGFAFLGGAALGRQKGLSPKSSVFAAVSAFGVSQVVVSILNHVRRRRQRKLEEEHEVASQISNLMAWNEALGALRKIVDTFSDGLAAPFTLKHLLLDAELLRRHHTFLYQECVLRERERSRSRELCGTSIRVSIDSCCYLPTSALPLCAFTAHARLFVLFSSCT